MNKIIREICELQEIDSKQMITCPYCEQQEVVIKEGKWYCSCGKHGGIMELLRLVEEDYLAKHPISFWYSKTNQGVEI